MPNGQYAPHHENTPADFIDEEAEIAETLTNLRFDKYRRTTEPPLDAGSRDFLVDCVGR